MDAGATGVERQLADRDAHATSALIAQTEDALAIGDDDDADLVEAGIGQDLADPVLVGIAEEHPARLAPDFAEPLAAFSDCWRIDQWQHLLDIAHQKRVEERLVGVLQI